MFVDLQTGAGVGVVGEEPGRAEGHGAWGGGDFGEDVFLEGGGEFGRGNDVGGGGGEGDGAALKGYPSGWVEEREPKAGGVAEDR